MSIRIVVSIDMEHTDDPGEAYEWLYKRLCEHEDMSWESTDEWYDADDERVPVATIQQCFDSAELIEVESPGTGAITVKRLKLNKLLNKFPHGKRIKVPMDRRHRGKGLRK